MATPTHHWKLGLFVVLGFALAMLTLVFVGAESLRKDTVRYVTYFDESVQGLELGAPLKFRGVTVGTIQSITIAPDSRHVAVYSDIQKDELENLGFEKDKKGYVPSTLRVQLASQGITGVKFLQIDFFDEKRNPLPELPFEVPPRYIPAAKSTFEKVEDALVTSAAKLPEMTEAVTKAANHAAQILERINMQIEGMNLPELGVQLRRSMANLDATLEQTNQILARLNGDKGFVATGQRVIESFGNIPSGELANELQETLRGIQSAAASIERLAETLEREPDMLIKGRSRGGAR
jgi:phospholipid/cholesterol/gamma-HCH transport system substrate-binding protein